MARESRRTREEKRFGKPGTLADAIVSTAVKDWRFSGELLRDPSTLKVVSSIQQSVAKHPVISINNVAEYFADHERDYWEWKKDFPCVTPPFDTCFVEFDLPTSMTIKGKRVLRQSNSTQKSGFLITRTDARGRQYPKNPNGDWANLEFETVEDATHYCVATSVVSVDSNIHYSGSFFMFVLNEKGEVVRGPDFATRSTGLDKSTLEMLSGELQEMLMPTFLGLSFMNCKNVTSRAIEPNPEVNRERRKTGLKPFLRYHTINIQPMKATLKTEGNIDGNGLKRAMHICRGHFVHYGQEAPLFGRLVGTYWKPAHVRGSSKEGVIISDYKVHSPEVSTPCPESCKQS